MATVQPTATDIGGDGVTRLAVWALTTANTDGAPLELTSHCDCCYQALGTFGGATVAIEGSNDGTNWFAMNKQAGGTAATLTAAGGGQAIERPRFIRPNLTTAGSGAAITANILARRLTAPRN